MSKRVIAAASALASLVVALGVGFGVASASEEPPPNGGTCNNYGDHSVVVAPFCGANFAPGSSAPEPSSEPSEPNTQPETTEPTPSTVTSTTESRSCPEGFTQPNDSPFCTGEDGAITTPTVNAG